MGNSSKKKESELLREMRAKRLAEEQAKKKRENRILWGVFGGIAVLLLIAGIVTFVMTRPEKKPSDSNPPINNDIGESPLDQLSNTVKITVSYTNASDEETTGEIIVKLDSENAPRTVRNFKKLVSESFYDGLTFHRIMSGFMIQGGDPKGDGTGGSSENIVGEFSNNGYNNKISHKRGVISMARQRSSYNPSAYYNTASSQFFIVHQDSTFLDGDYAAFGEVISGMDVVDGIAGTEVTGSENSTPVHPVKILKIEFVQ